MYLLAKCKFVLLALAFVAASCIDRINLDRGEFENNVNQVVIYGWISDGPGPYYVNIHRSSDPFDDLNFAEPINVREVRISDDVGNVAILEGKNGYYYTLPGAINGVVGRLYSVRVELLDGRVFESRPDLLTAPGSLDSVYAKFDSFKPTRGQTEYYYRILVDATTHPESKFVRWKFRAVHKSQTALNSCFTYIFEDKPYVSDDQYVVNSEFKNVELASIPVNGFTFFEKVMVEVEQQSLSTQAFEFWSAINDQKEGAESLFQPAIARLPGNIYEVSNNSPGFGIFYASSIKQKVIFLEREDLPVSIPAAPVLSDEACVIAFPFSTYFRPPRWED